MVIIQGPAGCGKNSLIDCLGWDKNITIDRYSY